MNHTLFIYAYTIGIAAGISLTISGHYSRGSLGVIAIICFVIAIIALGYIALQSKENE